MRDGAFVIYWEMILQNGDTWWLGDPRDFGEQTCQSVVRLPMPIRCEIAEFINKDKGESATSETADKLGQTSKYQDSVILNLVFAIESLN